MRLDPVDINVVQVCPRTGRTLHSKRHTATALSYCVAETDSAASHGRKVLVIGREEKTQQEFAIAGGVRVLARHAASEGKATIMLTQRNLQIMCQAEPNAMVGWLRGIADPAAAACFSPLAAGKCLADLPALARLRLRRLGVLAVYGNDGGDAWCTVRQSRFFSHRRCSGLPDALAGQTGGRMAACIWLD